MARSSQLRVAIAWVGLVVLFAVLFRHVEPQASRFVIAIGALVIATVVVGFARGRRAIARIHEAMVLGEPDRMLAIVDRKLRNARSGPNRAPLIVLRAIGLSMKGDFSRALSLLDELDPAALPDQVAWRFAYLSTRLSCLVLCERLDEARALFDRELSPLAEDSPPNQRAALEALEAQLAFCEGDGDRAMEAFARLVLDTTIPPPSRAVFHYFLGRIYHDRGNWSGCDQHFAEAQRLAPHTWVPAGVAAFRDATRLSP